MITNDSTSVFTVTKKNDEESWIRAYNIDTKQIVFEEQILGTYVKIKELEQTDDAQLFAAAFIDDGAFKIRTFRKSTRSQAEIEEEELNLNEELELNGKTDVVFSLPDPFITCTFVGNDLLFVNLFETHTGSHHHFFYHLKVRQENKLLPDDQKEPFITHHTVIDFHCHK